MLSMSVAVAVVAMIVVPVFFVSMLLVLLMTMLFMLLVRMLFVLFMIMVVVLLMAVLVMTMLFVAMLFVVMIIVTVLVRMFLFTVPVVVGFEHCPFAEGKLARTARSEEYGDGRILCQRLDRIFEPGRKIRPDPEHQIRILKRLCLGRAQVVLVGRCTGRDDQRGVSDLTHHLGHQRMHGRDVRGNARSVRKGRAGQQSCAERQGQEVSGHLANHVIL